MLDLSRAMGMGEQSIYNAFGNKESLLQAALRHYRGEQLEHIMGDLMRPDASKAAIVGVFENLVALAPRDGHGCLIVQCRQLGDGVSDGARSEAEAHAAQVERAFHRAIVRGVDNGEFATDDPQSLARYFNVALHGFAVATATVRSKAALRRVVALVLAPLSAAH